MSSQNDYGVSLALNFTSFDTVNKEYQTILKKLSTSGKIKIGTILEAKDLTDIQNKFKQIVNQKITFDTTGARTEIQTLKNSSNELITIMKKFKADGTTTSSISGSSSASLEAQKGIYKELNKLQTVEFNLKKQMITAEGGHYNELKRQLEITKELQKSANKSLNKNGLTEYNEQNALIKQRVDLQNKYNASVSKVNQNSSNLYEKDELKKTQIAIQEAQKRAKLEQQYSDKYNKLLNDKDRTSIANAIKQEEALLKSEIKVFSQYEAKLKEVNLAKLKLTQSTNIAKSDGLVNTSTSNNLLNQIGKINVNTTKADLDRVTESVNNLGKSGDRILTLTNEIKKYKTEVASLKANSSDALGIGNNVAKLAEYEKALQEALRVLNMLKKNSGSVSNASFNSAKLNLGFSANDLKSSVSSVENVQSKLVSLQGTITSLSNNGLYGGDFITTLQNKFNSFNTNTAENELKEFKTYLSTLSGGNETGIVKLSRDIDGFANKISALKSKYKGLVPDAELAKFDVLLNNLRTKLASMKNGEVIDGRKLASEINNVKSAYDKLNLSTKNSSMAFKTGNQDVKSFGSALVDTAGKMGIYLSSAIAFRKIFTEFKEAVEYTKTMDKGMTNIQMITGQTASQVSETVSQFKELGAELHVTNTEIIASSESLLRAGYSAEEAKKMMSASLMGSKVSGQTTQVVSEQLIAMKNAFGLSADSMEHYIDVISKLDNSSATSFAEIADAVQRTAFSAQQAGTPLETLMTYITTVSEKTRKSAETIGESFKTIYSRYSNIKLGNLDEDGKSINDTEKAMARVGIQIRDSKDSFREFDDVLQEFMTKYKSGELSQVDYLAGVQALAGTRQRETLMALSENMDTLNKHQEDVASSAGSAKAMLENAYDGSIDAKINDMKRSFEGLYETLLNSKTVGTGFDVISSGVQGISKAFGSLPTVIGLVVAGFTIFNTKFRESSTLYSNMLPFINTFNTKLLSMSTSLKATALGYSKSLTQLKSYTIAMQGAGMSTSGYATKLALLNTKLAVARIGMVALKVATIALQTVMSVGLSLVITGVITLVDNLIHKNEKLAESNAKFLESIKANEEAISSTTKLLEQKKSLEAQMKNSNITEEESLALKTQLVDIEKQIASALPESISGYTLEGEKISANNDLIQKQLDLKKEQIAIESKAILMKNNNLSENQKQVDLIKGDLEGFNANLSKNNDPNTKWNEKESYYGKSNGGHLITENGKGFTDGVDDLIEDLKTAETTANSTKQALLSMFNQGYTAKDIVGMKELRWSTEDVSSAMEELGYTKEEIAQSSNGVQISLSGENKELLKQNELLKDNNDAGEKAIDIKEQTTNYSTALAQQQKIADLQNEINESGKVTPSIIQSALDLYPQMGAKVFDITTLQGYLNDKISEQEAKQKEAYANMMQGDEDFFANKIKNTSSYETFQATVLSNLQQLQIKGFQSNADGMKTELDNAKTLGKARTAVESKVIEANTKMWAEYYSAIAMAGVKSTNGTIYNNMYDSYGNVVKSKNILDENNNIIGTEDTGYQAIIDKQRQQQAMIQAMKDASDSLIGGIDIITPQFSSTDFSNSGKGEKSSTEKEVEDIKDLIDIYYDLQNAMDVLSARQTYLKTTREGTFGKEYLANLQQELVLLEKQQKAVSNMANGIKNERWDLIRDLEGNWGFTFGSQGEVTNYKTRLKELMDYANSLTGETKENFKSALEEVSDKLQNYTDLTINQTNDMSNQWQEYNNQIKETYRLMGEAQVDAEGKISETYKHILQERLDTTKKYIDEIKNKLNTQWDEEEYADQKQVAQQTLLDIRSQINNAVKSGDKELIADLQKQYTEQQKTVNDMIRDHEREQITDKLDKEESKLDEQLAEMLKPENLNQTIQTALQEGYFKIGDEIIGVQSAMKDLTNDTVEGFMSQRIALDQYLSSLSTGIEMAKQMNTITSEMGLISSINNIPIIPSTAYSSVNNANSKTIQINSPLVSIQNMDNSLLPQVQGIVDNAINGFARQINNEYKI